MSKESVVMVLVNPCQGDADEVGVVDAPCLNKDTRKYKFKDRSSWNGAEYAYSMDFWLCADCHAEAINQDY